MKVSLSNYIEKIEVKYQNARKEWEKIQSEVGQENKRYNNVEWINLTPKGQEAEHIRHIEKLKEIKNKFRKIRESFENEVEKIVESSDKVFDYAHKHKPELIDNNGLAIINNSNFLHKLFCNIYKNFKLFCNFI